MNEEDVVCEMSCFFISSIYPKNSATSSWSAVISPHLVDPKIRLWHFYFKIHLKFPNMNDTSVSFVCILPRVGGDPTPFVRLSAKDNWRTSRNRDKENSFWKRKEQIEGLFSSSIAILSTRSRDALQQAIRQTTDRILQIYETSSFNCQIFNN